MTHLPIDQSSHTNSLSTQTAFPRKATLRTAIQTAVPAILALAAAFTIFSEELSRWLPEEWRIWAVSAGAFLVAVAAVLTRVMALESVNGWLTKFGLGATPKTDSDSY